MNAQTARALLSRRSSDPAGSGRLRLPARAGRLELLIALGCAAMILAEALIRARPGTSPTAYLLILLAAGPLTFQIVAPLRTLLASAAGAVLCAAVLRADWTVTGVICLELFAVALLGDRKRSLAVGVVAAIAVAAAVVVIAGAVDPGGLLARVMLVFLAVATGELIRSRLELRIARREQREREERERNEQLERRAAAERMQIARELHDTLAHSLVAINVRASVAIDVPESQDPTDALDDIKHASARALHDLRATLSVLREEGDAAPVTPAPGLDTLRGLIDHARTAGLDAELDLRVDEAAVSAAIGAAAARIVQESITNVIRHAHATQARISVRTSKDTLHVEVSDNGRTVQRSVVQGFGIRGMSERAAALGGALHAGPAPTGGWAVKARLPLAGRAAP